MSYDQYRPFNVALRLAWLSYLVLLAILACLASLRHHQHIVGDVWYHRLDV